MFAQEKVSFLGFSITSAGITPDPDKLGAISKFEVPKNRRELQQFLGICNYYRQFSVRHSYSVDPLRELLQKNGIWEWTEKHSQAFETLKDNFRKCIELKHVIPERSFNVQTDASDKGVCGILYQLDEEGQHNVIAIASRCLTKPEINYSTTEKELLAILYSLEKFRTYIIGVPFVIITDHQCLTFLKSVNFQNARIARWSLILQQYSFSIKYCRGIDNVVADFFSRNPEGKFLEDNPRELIISALHSCFLPNTTVNDDNALVTFVLSANDLSISQAFKKLGEIQRDDTILGIIFEKSKESKDDSLFCVHEKILFHREKLDDQ